jgi:hypothetical protein
VPWYEFTCENERCRQHHRYFHAGSGRRRRFCNEFCRRGQNRRDATLAFVAAMRALREERIAAGLCPSCGEPAAPGRVLCEHHLEYHRNLKRALRRGKRADGLCIYASCDRLAIKGGYCARHYLQESRTAA